jgi:hypothetical protein
VVRKAPRDLSNDSRRQAKAKAPKERAFTRQKTYKVLHGDLVSAIVDLDVVAVEVERVATVSKDAPGEMVARIAGHIVGEHEDDIRVGYAESFHGAVPAFFVLV